MTLKIKVKHTFAWPFLSSSSSPLPRLLPSLYLPLSRASPSVWDSPSFLRHFAPSVRALPDICPSEILTWLRLKSCPRVTFLGPDPITPKPWPDPSRNTRQKVWPDPTRHAARPFPNMYSLQLNNYIYKLVNYYIKYLRKSINPNVVFEDSHQNRFQEIISKN